MVRRETAGEVTLSVRVPADLAEAVRSTAADRDETIAQVVRRFLRVYVAASAGESITLEHILYGMRGPGATTASPAPQERQPAKMPVSAARRSAPKDPK